MNLYISDLHFGFEDIIERCNRHYENVFEMNQAIIDIINNTGTSKDKLIINGDVACYNYNPVKELKAINREKILIIGNHDKHWLKEKSFRDCFEKITGNIIIHDGDYKINLSHCPMAEWDGFYKGIYHFYGHIHNSTQGAARIMALYERAVNVSLDYIKRPRTAQELIEFRRNQYEKHIKTALENINISDYRYEEGEKK